jgi:hypothetical protein
MRALSLDRPRADSAARRLAQSAYLPALEACLLKREFVKTGRIGLAFDPRLAAPEVIGCHGEMAYSGALPGRDVLVSQLV